LIYLFIETILYVGTTFYTRYLTERWPEWGFWYSLFCWEPR